MFFSDFPKNRKKSTFFFSLKRVSKEKFSSSHTSVNIFGVLVLFAAIGYICFLG